MDDCLATFSKSGAARYAEVTTENVMMTCELDRVWKRRRLLSSVSWMDRVVRCDKLYVSTDIDYYHECFRLLGLSELTRDAIAIAAMRDGGCFYDVVDTCAINVGEVEDGENYGVDSTGAWFVWKKNRYNLVEYTRVCKIEFEDKKALSEIVSHCMTDKTPDFSWRKGNPTNDELIRFFGMGMKVGLFYRSVGSMAIDKIAKFADFLEVEVLRRRVATLERCLEKE